jgi:glyoxylase I family protein
VILELDRHGPPSDAKLFDFVPAPKFRSTPGAILATRHQEVIHMLHNVNAVIGRSAALQLHGVRYQDLGFKLEHQQLPAFANVSLGDFKLLISGPGASGSRPMPDGHRQEPGGWNRVVLRVTDLPARIEALKKAGLHFRNEMEVGPDGKQIQLEDPDGNPIALFEPAR